MTKCITRETVRTSNTKLNFILRLNSARSQHPAGHGHHLAPLPSILWSILLSLYGPRNSPPCKWKMILRQRLRAGWRWKQTRYSSVSGKWKFSKDWYRGVKLVSAGRGFDGQRGCVLTPHVSIHAFVHLKIVNYILISLQSGLWI